MPRAEQHEDNIGVRLRALRERRGWSIRFVASRADINASTLSRLERGLRSSSNRFLLHDLAAALECSVVDITGQPYPASDAALERAHRGMTALRAALVEAAPDEPATEAEPVIPMPRLAELAALTESRYDAADSSGMVDLLAQTIPQQHAHGVAGDREAVRLLAQSAYAAESIFRSLGYPAESWIAAERCREAAEWLDEPVVVAIADCKRAASAAGCIGYRRGQTIAARAIDAVQPHLGQPDGLVALGMLHLNSSASSMGQQQTDTAVDHLTEAERIAERTGETTSWRLWFGPANVAVWRVGIEVDAGRPGPALELARKTTVSGLPAFRQATFYTDIARGLATDRRTHDRAVQALLTAERAAPQQMRSSPLARETARDLRDTARRLASGPRAGR